MRIAVATPVRAADVMSAQVSYGYANFVRAMAKDGAEFIDGSLVFSADVVRARNRIVAHVLRECPHIDAVFWLDDDQYFENPDDGVRVIREMYETGEEVIGCPYTSKKPPLRWVHQLLTPCPLAVNGVQQVRGLGFGATLTRVSCLRKMSESARVYTDHPATYKVANLFGQVYDSPRPGLPEDEDALLSEDYSFCKRWRNLGGRVCLYTAAGIVMHAGPHAHSAREMPGGVIG
jgi:hypothetical protein